MASKSSASVGMMASLAVFALLSLVLFVLTVVFMARTQKMTKEKDAAVADLAIAVKADERDDRWEELKSQARSANVGVVRYLDGALRDTLKLAGGTRNDTPDTVREKFEKRTDVAPTMTGTIDRRDQQIADLRRDLENAERDRDNALADMKAGAERIKLIEDEHSATVAKLNSEIDGYKSELDRFREGVETTQRNMLDTSAQARAETDREIADLQSRNGALSDRVLVLEGMIKNLQGATQKNRLTAPNEAEMVDARIVGINAAAREVYLSIGRAQHVVVGMPFEVYSRGTSIRPDADGQYPAGKASVEVVRIDEGTCVARIIREARGNPIIDGDFVANAVYDPNKKYVFTVYGNFDANRDGIPTPGEAADIRALIDQWGGTVRDDIGGDTDFLVLGTRPVLPPEPKETDPVELINRYLRLKQAVQRYDDLFETARRTGIPVLNQNRFETLTGQHGQR